MAPDRDASPWNREPRIGPSFSILSGSIAVLHRPCDRRYFLCKSSFNSWRIKSHKRVQSWPTAPTKVSNHDTPIRPKTRMGNCPSPLSVNATEFCRQDRNRPCGCRDHGRPKTWPGRVWFSGSSFFFLFSISAIVVGFIANRIQTRWVILALALVWAAVQFPMVGPVSFATLMISRIILGAGEGPGFSVAVHAIYKWFPDERRNLPTAILSQGAAFGVIVAVPALNWVIVSYSWHHAFGALGIAGFLWAIIWLIVGKEGPLQANIAISTSTELARVPYLQLLTSRTFIGCCLSTFGPYWALSLGLTWFTPFIVTGLHFSQKAAGWITILPWVTGAAVVLFGLVLSVPRSSWHVHSRCTRRTRSRTSPGRGGPPLIRRLIIRQF